MEVPHNGGFVMEHLIYKLMMTGGTPISGNLKKQSYNDVLRESELHYIINVTEEDLCVHFKIGKGTKHKR